MRCFLAIATGLWVGLAAAGTTNYLYRDASEAREIEVLHYSASEGHTTLSVPCSGCLPGEADESLVFDIQVNPTPDPTSSEVIVGGKTLHLTWNEGHAIESSTTLNLPDSSSTLRQVDVSWEGVVDSPPISLFGDGRPTQNVNFVAKFSDLEPSTLFSFILIMRPSSEDRLVAAVPHIQGAPMVTFGAYRDFSSSESFSYASEVDEKAESSRSDEYDEKPQDRHSDDFDLEGEVETLRLLEHQAHQLDVQISARRKAIAYTLKQDRDKLCIKHLVKECDGVTCAARAVLQRICDKVGVRTDPTYGFPRVKNSGTQKSIAFHPDQRLGSHNCTGEKSHLAESANIPLIQTKGDNYDFHAAYYNQSFDLINPSNQFLRAVQIVAGLLGITAIIAFIKRRCMSVRRRRERAADLEERRNARAYKRAARRALMRKRWNNFLNTINCFGSRHDPIPGDYEEKRALILQDSFLEQDLDQAEKGEVMEAELRELRYAHEIVSSLVRVDDHRYAVATNVHDPPPSMVPLPPPRYASRPQSTRSRAASTYTLPSYFSESLPDYTSRPGYDTDSSSSVANGYTPSTSESQGRQSPVTPPSDCSRRTRYTPTSSVLEMSPRASEETLRTRPSGDRQCRGQSLDSVLRM
ncbi:uncharacterized protein LTR77_001018 [Saxophila tyrrhenica]|uniref:Uncharacterized protein n=1 Tax=Saxophila tyrrhenica TaxID=1690608 RepID=A0AAV9PRK5_9PEZI|nr:hypothetical protein LTR77_001018 [Saxophila tyrrhenica]